MLKCLYILPKDALSSEVKAEKLFHPSKHLHQLRIEILKPGGHLRI